VAIDRERCILCYRCVRFSQEVAEDEQLQFLERGDQTFVGTFDERPYVAPFHGNVIELCPVGALTTYTYRFRARPWDIEDAGSVCTLCPSQCNVRFSIRDEQVLRVLARDNEDVDDGWLCDKGRFAFQSFTAEDRITQPMARGGDGNLVGISWEEALKRVTEGLRAAGSKASALVGGGTTNEEGWLLQRILRDGLGAQAIDCASSPIDPGELRELSDPELTARVSDLDYAGAVLVLGVDPINEMPILDLRIRKGVRRNGVRLAVATEAPNALDGGAEAFARYAPGEATSLVRAILAEVRSPGSADGELAERAGELATSLREAEDAVIVWGEGLWREPGAVGALLELAGELGLAAEEGSGLLEVPSEANGRGLREVGCLPGVGPGLREAAGGSGASEIRAGLKGDELSAIFLCGADPVRTHPDSDGWREALRSAFTVAISQFDDASTRQADIVLPAETFAEKEGTLTHPDGRLQRLRPNVPRPGEVTATWKFLAAVADGLGCGVAATDQPDLLGEMAADVGLYSGLSDEEIGGRGIRWQERTEAGAVPSGGSAGARTTESAATAGNGAGPGANGTGLALGTRHDLWAAEAVDHSPALRFLVPSQSLQISPADAEALGLTSGDEVVVSADGRSVEARVAVRDRMGEGVAFLIAGTNEDNGNVLATGKPQRVEISPKPAPVVEQGAAP